MYLRLIDGKPERYALGYLRIENPNVSFPRNIPDEMLASYDVYRYEVDEQPEYNTLTQDIWDGGFYQDETGQWRQWWKVTDKAIHTAKRNIREERDRLLSATDWVVVKANERGNPVPQAWADYRQAMRDVPDQAGFPYSVEWPTKPE